MESRMAGTDTHITRTMQTQLKEQKRSPLALFFRPKWWWPPSHLYTNDSPSKTIPQDQGGRLRSLPTSCLFQICLPAVLLLHVLPPSLPPSQVANYNIAVGFCTTKQTKHKLYPEHAGCRTLDLPSGPLAGKKSKRSGQQAGPKLTVCAIILLYCSQAL